MKIVKRMISVLLVLMLVVGTSVTVSATEYAYSIGHDFGIDIPLVEDYEGDFTENVNYAATIYGMLGYSSNYSYNPTYEYLRGTNPSGGDRLGSSVVFLNGHGNYDNLICGDTVDDAVYKCGVYMNHDFTSSSSGYTYAGLDDRDLSDVKLISFVGCKTATKDDNLCTSAIDGGADCAIGFTNSIHSRTTAGKNWLKKFHDALGNGSTIEEAIDVATIAYPSSDLGDYIKIYGDVDLDLELSSTRSVSYENSYDSMYTLIEESQFGDLPIEINQDMLISLGVAIDLSTITCGEYFDLSAETDVFEEIINVLSCENDDFDVSDYKVLVNEYAQGKAIIKVRYYIDNIETSAVNVFIVKDGKVEYMSNQYSFSQYDEVNETALIGTASEFEIMRSVSTVEAYTAEMSDEVILDNQECRYYYEFEEGKLYYIIDMEYSIPGMLGVIVSEETYIEVN